MADEEKNPLAGIVEGEEELEAPDLELGVSPMGEEIPDDVNFIEDYPVDDSKIEEPSKEVIGETEPVLSPVEKQFQDSGLERRYPGGVSDMIAKQRETDQYIARLEAERNALRDNPKTPEPQTEVTDEFFEPETQSAIKKLVDAQLESINSRLAQNEISSFQATKADFKEMEPLMEQFVEANPVLKNLPFTPESLDIVYKLAKEKQLSQAKPTPAQPQTPVLDKASAAASVGKSKAALSPNDPERFHEMTDAEIEAELGMKPLY